MDPVYYLEQDMFNKAVAIILKLEGDIANLPDDPGGPTMFGIAHSFHPNEPWPITRERAVEIYESEYWTPLRCRNMAPPVAVYVLDTGVNMGVGYAARMVQRFAHVIIDSTVGVETLAAMSKLDPKNLCRQIHMERSVFDASTRYADGLEGRLFDLCTLVFGVGGIS